MGDVEKVIIIGGACAGLTAAIYTARAKLNPLLFAGHMFGGQLMMTSDVENYPGFPEGVQGPKLMEKFRQQAEKFGTRIVYENVIKVDFSERPFRVWAGGDEHVAESVIVATGARPRMLGLESEAMLMGLRASKIMQERAFENPKINFVWDSVVEDIYDVNEGKVTGVLVKNVKTRELSEIKCDGVFIAIGHEPNTDVFVGQLALDSHGYIKVHDHVKTSVEGVFAAGDVHDRKYRQAITASAFGCMAALECERYLAEKGLV